MQEFLASLGKHKFVIAALLAVGVLLIIVGGASSRSADAPSDGDVRDDYERALEERLTALCLRVEGIDEAAVLVTADGESADGAYYSAQAAIPTVRGVAAVVTRGDDPAVRRTIVELISASLGIPTNRVSVAPCK